MMNLFNACEWITYDYEYDNTPLRHIKSIISHYAYMTPLYYLVNVEVIPYAMGVFYKITGNPLAVRFIRKKIYNYIIDNYPQIVESL